MKFTHVIAALATVVGIAAAALPVEPPNAFVFSEDQMQKQQVVGEHNPLASDSLAGLKSYIVVFKDSTAAHVVEKAIHDIESLGGKIGQRYTAAINGFSAKIPTAIVTALSTNPFIDYIEEDGEVVAYNV
ncbi:hypothetical protein BGW41_004189 [Actinomortierella wolfii]|nr:hypothetical protein BGW41_004189 [Actinomortierella wolfii]